MARSFKEYIDKNFYDDLFDCVNDYLEHYSQIISGRCYNLKSIGDFALSDIEIINTYVEDAEDLRIKCQILVSATVDVQEGHHRFDNYAEMNIWFIIIAIGDLACEFEDFEILDIRQYERKPSLKNSLSISFVPNFRIGDLDRVAEDFLQRYYPETLKTPGAININKLVERLGLIKREEPITADCSVFGRIYFRDSEEIVYDSNGNIVGKRFVKAGTILTDPKIFFLRNLGTLNNTVIHECVHWIFHRKYFEWERLFDVNITQIDCRVVGGLRGMEKWSNTDKIEWQANALTPRIQMPLHSFKSKADEFMCKYRSMYNDVPAIDVMERVIIDLADFFSVSKMSAKIRMKEVGYEEAAGTFIWIGGHYVKAHQWKKGFLKENQTFSIGVEDLIKLCFETYELRDDSAATQFVYVDSHLVLNSPQYVSKDTFGNLQLTDYARTHMDECCVVFEMFLTGGGRENYHTECFLNRDRDADISFSFQYSNGLENSSDEKKRAALQKMMDEEEEMYSSLPRSYPDIMKNLMKLKEMTETEVAEEINVDPRTVRRVMKGESGKIETLAAICLSLQLPPNVSDEVINKSKWKFDPLNKNHKVLRFALHHLYSHKFQYIRQFLNAQNVTL